MVLVKCSRCKSTNIERITTFDRMISVGTKGLSSGKMVKQNKCQKCKHMW